MGGGHMQERRGFSGGTSGLSVAFHVTGCNCSKLCGDTSLRAPPVCPRLPQPDVGQRGRLHRRGRLRLQRPLGLQPHQVLRLVGPRSRRAGGGRRRRRGGGLRGARGPCPCPRGRGLILMPPMGLRRWVVEGRWDEPEGKCTREATRGQQQLLFCLPRLPAVAVQAEHASSPQHIYSTFYSNGPPAVRSMVVVVPSGAKHGAPAAHPRQQHPR